MQEAFHKHLIELSAAGLSLSATASLGTDVRTKTEQAQSRRVIVEDGHVIVRQGDFLDNCYVVRSGWVARQKSDLSGRRTTANVFLPGNIFAVHLNFKRRAQFDIVALEQTEIAIISSRNINALVASDPVVAAALDWNATRSFNIISEHMVGMSTRFSTQRILHLLLEFWCRLVVVGQASENSFHLPITQDEIAEMVGLSVVSVNRGMQELRRSNIITVEKKKVTFNDIKLCLDYAGFDPSYLGLFEPIVGLNDNLAA